MLRDLLTIAGIVFVGFVVTGLILSVVLLLGAAITWVVA